LQDPKLCARKGEKEDSMRISAGKEGEGGRDGEGKKGGLAVVFTKEEAVL